MYNILLVDDESAAKMAFCDLFWIGIRHPYTIVGTARNGREALDFVQKQGGYTCHRSEKCRI